jgi:uncharacterized protein
VGFWGKDGVFMRRFLLIAVGALCCSSFAASAQTSSPEAMQAARSLVVTMRLADQYKALLPAILLRIKPVVTQERAELESDYDIVTARAGDAYTPYYNEMLERVASIYAANFTIDEMRQIDAFLHQPAGRKLIEKWPAIGRQTDQVVQDISQKAADDLKRRLTEALRQKGHKL